MRNRNDRRISELLSNYTLHKAVGRHVNAAGYLVQNHDFTATQEGASEGEEPGVC